MWPTLYSSPAELLVGTYAHSLMMRGAAPATFRRYKVFLQQFAAWLDGRHPSEVSAAEIADQYLLAWWENFEAHYGRAPSANTVRNHHTALSAFFSFLEARDLVVANPMRKLAPERPKGVKKRNDFLSLTDDGDLGRALNTGGAHHHQPASIHGHARRRGVHRPLAAWISTRARRLLRPTVRSEIEDRCWLPHDSPVPLRSVSKSSAGGSIRRPGVLPTTRFQCWRRSTGVR